MSLNSQKKKRLGMLSALAMTFVMALFTQALKAQTTTIFMRDGSTTIERNSGLIYFYDSHGPATVPECWNYWYQHNEDFTYVFKPKTEGDKIKVTFNSFMCYNNDVEIGNWALRLNDDFLYAYEGNGVNADNLIAALTGNSAQSFTIMADGAITFRFVSNSRYREEGWFATVELVQENVGMSAQAPFIRRSTCHNAAELMPTTLGAQIWYTTDGSDPTTSSTAELYKDEIDFPASGSFTVKAASKLNAESSDWSDVATATFTDDDRVPVPGIPTITREANSNVIVMTPAEIPSNVNETYIVRYTYTTNGTEPAEPDLTNSTLYTGPITCTTPNTWYKAKTFGLSCTDWVSTETAELTVTTIYCPTPTILFGDDMFILASEGGVTYNILYTLDGTEPSLSPLNGTQSAITVSLAGIPYGTTVKALAFKMNGTDVDTQHQPSTVVSAIYVPTDEDGNTQNGTYGNIVLIDDREDHSWSYYSDDSQPIHKLNPADIKITYSGNGTNNMTPNSNSDANPANSAFTENATNVHVNIDAQENQFVYLKTLERDNADGSGNLAYTTIPNPFQVRPIHQSSKGATTNNTPEEETNRETTNTPDESVKRATPDGMIAPAYPDFPFASTQQPDRASADVTYEKVTSAPSDWSGNYLLVYDYSTTQGYAFSGVNSSYQGTCESVALSNSGSSIESPGSAAILTLAPYSGNTSYYTIQINNGNYLLSSYDGFMTGASATNGTYTDSDNVSRNYYCYFNVSYSSGTLYIYCPQWQSSSGSYYYIKFNTSSNYFVETTSTSYSYPNLYKQTTSGSSSSDCDTEDFSGYTAASYYSSTYELPDGWTTYTNTSSYCYPARVSNSSSYSYIDELTENYLLMTAYGTSGEYATYAIMPQYSDITSVTFNYVYESTSDGTLTVGYVTDNTGYSTYTVLDTPTKSGTKTSYPLSEANMATINSSNGYIAFRYVSTGSSTYYSVGIDDVVVCTGSSSTPSISVAPTIATITTGNTVQLTATTANASGAAITWSSNNTAVATVVTNSKDTSTATVTGVAPGAAVITSSITVDGTTYTASSAITVVAPSYCSPAPTSIDGTGIHPVVFGSGSEIVNNTAYPTSSPYYGDYSSQIGAYQQGATATVEITYNTGYTYGTLIWVDWDGSYTFDDDEIVATGTSTSTSGSSMTFSFSIPSDQAVGYYRMRIGAADSYFDNYISGTTSAAHDPCSTGTYKVFHDYTLHVTTAIEPPVAPVFSVAGGTYTEAQTVTITCASSGAEIYYTTDGSNPSNTNGTLISSGATVTISATTILKAVAYNGALSDITSATYYISASGGGSLTCEDFESYASSANSSYNTAGSLPTGWAWYYQTYYHGNSSYAPHLYTGTMAKDGVGIIMTAGYDSYDSGGGGTSTTYVGYGYWLESNILLQEGATVTFNTWVESTSYGTMTYGYFDDDDTWHSLGVATTANYSGATNADGVTTFTVATAANGYKLCFRWVYSTSTSGTDYSAVIDNVCQEISDAPNAPVFDLAEGDYTGTQTVTITCSTADATIYYTTDGTEPSAANGTTIASGGTVTISTTTTLQAVAINAYGASAITQATYNITQGASSNADYRGFYAWRVKSLSSGLTIQSKDGNTTYAVNSIIPAETDIQFVTSNAEGNEVEFEALWARAYVTTTTSISGLNANVGYERNFMVLGSDPGTSLTNKYIPSQTGTTTTTNGTYIPLYVSSSNYPYSISQQIYTASEIGRSGEISAIGFRVYSSSSSNRTLHIYMTHTTRTTFDYNDDWEAYATVPQYTSNLVYSGTVNFNSTGWKSITLDTPFDYDGTSNILITVFDVTGSYMSTPPTFYTYSSSTYSSVYARRSSAYTENGYYFAASGRLNYNPQLLLSFNNSVISGVSVPMTVTTYNPDGTGGSTTVKLSNSISCAANLKIENIKMNSLGTINGNGHDLVIGRGVTPYESDGLCVQTLTGISSGSSSAVSYIIRVESGTFQSFYPASNQAASFGNTFSVKAVLGSDYDRANSDNDKLSMSPSSHAGEIYGGNRMNFTNSANKENLTFDWIIKSGKFHDGILGAGEGGDQALYLGSSQASGTNAAKLGYIGKRRALIEGGELASLAGGMNQDDTDSYTTYGSPDVKDMVMIRMKGGTINGAIYGAAAFAGAVGGRTFVITGGDVLGWIAGGCNGTHTDGGELYGDTYIYVGGKAQVGNSEGGNHVGGQINYTENDVSVYGINGADGGIVFGAGCGINPTDSSYEPNGDYQTNTVGRVNNSSVVIADNATIWRDVYGGGNFGYVRADGSTDLYVHGGTIKGNVYGGSNSQQAQTVNILMSNGSVEGNIYGGSDSWGTTNGLATINVSGGSVTNVFGGGYGSNTSMATGTAVTVSDGTVTNNVYGGGEEGTVNGATNVTFSGGTVNDVYGAGKGGETTALVSGTTTVTVSGGTVNGAVYGGGEAGNVGEESDSGTEGDCNYSEGFESVTGTSYSTSGSMPSGWYSYTTATGNSIVAPHVVSGTSYNYYNGGSQSLGLESGTNADNTAYAVMPAIANGESYNTLKFYYRQENASRGTLSVGYVTAQSASACTNFSVIRSITASTTLHEETVDVSSVPSSAYLAFCWVVTSGSYYACGIDDVCLTVTTSSSSTVADLASTVTVSGGEVKGDVFGGGKMGTTNGSTVVNVTNGILRQNVFGGAYGEHGSVFVGGLKTVNVMGGRIYGSVYGGSRNANDGNSLGLASDSFSSSTETATTSVTNITGGQIDQHVYAAGYYGNTFGSVYAFLGLNAVQNAPNNAPNTGTANLEYTKSKLLVNGSVWAGGDWGVFSGEFGDPTVSGNSNIYIDGEGYSTDGNDPAASNYMNILGSILGSGTSCDAGKGERLLLVRNYGADAANTGDDADVNPFSHATRQSSSIQRFHNIVFDNTHMGFTGQGKINSLNNTEKYALYEIDENVHVANGSTLVMNAPSSQIKSFHSVTCDDTYASTPAYDVVNYDGLGSTGGETDNKVRVNGGSYIEVRYFEDPDNPADGEKSYGELEGFFHIMTSNDSDDATCAYARPKQSQEQGNIIPDSEDNADDGGFVAYLGRYNQYSATGALVAEGEQVQVRYENHTPNMRDNSEYFRIWRYGGNHHYIEGILNAEATSEGDDYKTVTVTVQLPAWTGDGSYYRFDRTGTSSYNTLIDYGSDVLTYNAACYTDLTTGNNWMYYDYENETQVTGVGTSNTTIAANIAAGIDDNPNLNYGLVIIPGQAMSGDTYIINGDADEYLANLESPFTCADNTKVPTVTFTLTYSNALTANMTWDPILIPLVQCSADGTITDYVTVALTINTSTEITSGFVTQVYARMNGGTNIHEQATVNVVLPTFTVAETGEMSQFTLVNAVFTPAEGINPSTGEVDANYSVTYVPKNSESLNVNSFGMTIAAVANPDNTDDWRFVTGEQDGNPGDGTTLDLAIGQAGGRSSLTFGVTLYYNSNVEVNAQTHMGDVTFTIGFTNFSGGTGDDYYSEFTVTVEVYRIGSGKNFYVDGINGLDASDENRGKYPDKPAKTINYIFNRLGFLPGDNIFVVDNLPITKATTWDGSAFQNDVNVYRYPGGHVLAGEDPEFDNSPYTGALVEVSKDLTVKGLTIDGMYAEATASEHNSTLYPDACTFDGEAEAPLITITDGGRVNLTSVTALKNNYNGNTALTGGAVNVAYGGILAMNMASSITGNISDNGGAVYMDGSMIVADSIYVFDNYQTTAMTQQNNVYLAKKTEGNFRVVQIGTAANDAYDELQVPATSTLITKIGVTKEDWTNTYEGYMPVVYAESGSESFLNKPYDSQELIVHDGNIYDLERYVTDLHSDSPLYLYWLGTWVTAQTWNPVFESANADGYTPYMTAEQLNNINTAEQLAWIISLANGENGVDKTDANYLLDNVTLTGDIDMSANIWVPIGNETDAFVGTFEGNGHVVSGLLSPLNRTNMGMFGVTDGAVISDMVVNAQFNTTAANLGTVVGTMNGGVLSNVEGAGTLTNNYANGNTGGLVGVNAETTGTAGIIHSSFAAADITGGQNIGGLVAINYGNLINSYSNVVMTDANRMAGLVVTNNGLVENCYSVRQNDEIPAFAVENHGTINYCYFNKDTNEELNQVNYQPTGNGTLSYPGYYAMVPKTGTYGYMYYDNIVHDIDNNNTYVPAELTYADNQIDKWPGLLSVLNQWVKANSSSDMTYTSWLRPTSKDINSDLPVLCFPKDNCLGTIDGRYLLYSAYDEHVNGLDNLLSQFEDNTGYIFLYDDAKDVTKVPTANVNVFINEDAVLLQANDAGDFINANVGVSFDNSFKNANDYWGNTLAYDWHFLSTPLANAPMGLSWSDGQVNWWDTENWNDAVGQVTGVGNSYLPDGTDHVANWDFYSYYEPQYHWINFKRNSQSHAHYDEDHDWISYTNETELVPGKGYMAAIDKDSYLGNKGTLNGPAKTVSINLTCSGSLPEVDDPTKDWGFNLLGNPYQAYLDMETFLITNGLSSYWVYIAEQNKYVAGDVEASANPALPSATLHPHQAFFVRTTADKEASFTYDMATAEPNDYSYFRGKMNYPLVNLFVANEVGQRDLAVVEFNRPKTGGAKKLQVLNNADFTLSASMGDSEYSILFTEEGTDRVPVRFTTRDEGTYTMTWQTMHGTFTGLYLIDNKTGVRTDMLHNDHYTFNATADDYASRFYITFRVTDVDDYNTADGEEFAFFDGSEWVVDGQGQLDVIDVTGRVLQSQQLSGETSRIRLNNYAAGVYVLRITNAMTTKSQKIIIK